MRIRLVCFHLSLGLVALALLAGSAKAATVVVADDSFADGITNSGAQQLGFNTTSSGSALDLGQAGGPMDYATGNSGRTIHGLFAAQTLAAFGDSLDVSFDFTTPASIANDNGVPSTNEDFKFGLFNTAGTSGAIDPNTGVAIDFTQNISTSSGSPNPALNGLAGFIGEIDNINAAGTDLGIRTANVNGDAAASAQGGQFLNSNNGFDFISGGTDDIINLLPNTDYVGSISVAFTDATLTSLDVTIGMMDAAGIAFTDSHTDTISIADVPGTEVGVNTTTFDLLGFHATSGAFGGTDNPMIPGGSSTGDANNGIDISNVTISFTTAAVPEPGSFALLSLLGCAGFMRRRR